MAQYSGCGAAVHPGLARKSNSGLWRQARRFIPATEVNRRPGLYFVSKVAHCLMPSLPVALATAHTSDMVGGALGMRLAWQVRW